jgi:hypothetical protein
MDMRVNETGHKQPPARVHPPRFFPERLYLQSGPNRGDPVAVDEDRFRPWPHRIRRPDTGVGDEQLLCRRCRRQ